MRTDHVQCVSTGAGLEPNFSAPVYAHNHSLLRVPHHRRPHFSSSEGMAQLSFVLLADSCLDVL